MKTNTEETLINQGIVAYSAGKYDEAITSFLEVLNKNPDCLQAICYLGHAYRLSGQPEKALEYYRKVVLFVPKDFNAWLSVGIAAVEIKAYQEAIDAYQKSLEIKPDNGAAWSYLAAAHFTCCQYKEAIVCYQKSVELHPQNVQLWNCLGMAHLQLPEYEEAMVCYQKSLEIMPDSADAWASLRFCYTHINEHNKAIAWLQKYVQTKTINNQVWIQLSTCYLALNRPDEALFAACRAYDLDENFPPAFYALLKSLIAMKYRHAAFFLIKMKFPETASAKNNKKNTGPKKQEHLLIHGKELSEALANLAAQKEEPITEQEKRHILFFQHKNVLQEIGEFYWNKQNKHLACCYFEYLLALAPGKKITISEKSLAFIHASIGITYFDDTEYERAFPYVKQAASKNNPIAMHTLGLYYQQGHAPVEQNEKLALETFKQAGAFGCSDSQFEAGLIYASKEPPEPAMAFKYYKAAAQNDKNHIQAQYLTALFYIDGIVIPQDFTKADFYLKRAVTDYRACFMLGLMYGFGIEGTILANRTIALLYLEKAKELGCKQADRMIDLIANPENAFIMKFFSAVIALVKRKYMDLPPPEPIAEKNPEPQTRSRKNKKNKNRNPGKPVERPQKTLVIQAISEKKNDTAELEQNPLTPFIAELEPTIQESIKKKNVEILQHTFHLISNQATYLTCNLHMPFIVFHSYDFVLQVCIQVMKNEIEHLGNTIAKRRASDRPKPKLQLAIKESIGYLNQLFDTYEKYRMEYEILLFSLQGNMLSPEKKAKAQTSYEFIADLYKKFLIDYSLCMENYDKMLELIAREKIAHKLRAKEPGLQLPKKSDVPQQQKAPSPYKCEQNTLKETETMIEKTNLKINTLFKFLFSKHQTKASLLEVDITPYQKEFDLVGACTDIFVLTGSTALGLIREGLFNKGALCTNKKYLPSKEQDRDFCGVYMDAARTSHAGFSPSLQNAKLFSYTGAQQTTGHVELYCLFWDQKATFNALVAQFQANAVTTMDACVIDNTGSVYGKLEWMRDIVENQVRLLNDYWNQFNQDSMRIFYVIKKMVMGGTPDSVCTETIKTWVKKGNISDVEHFKLYIKKQVNHKELTYATAFFKILCEYEILTKVFGTSVKNLQQLHLLLKPIADTMPLQALKIANEPGATVSNLGIFGEKVTQSANTAEMDQPDLPSPPPETEDPECPW